MITHYKNGVRGAFFDVYQIVHHVKGTRTPVDIISDKDQLVLPVIYRDFVHEGTEFVKAPVNITYHKDFLHEIPALESNFQRSIIPLPTKILKP
jgi:hypothetical protein